MNIYKVVHSNMDEVHLEEKFFNSKNKAKRELRKMFKLLEPKMEKAEPINLPQTLVHKRQVHLNGKSKISFEILFEVWRMPSYVYDDYNVYIESLYIEKVEVN